jgi:hypothetical protein
MRRLFILVALFDLALGQAVRGGEHNDGPTPEQTVRQLEGTWATHAVMSGWEILVSIKLGRAVVICTNDGDAVTVLFQAEVEVHGPPTARLLRLRNISLPPMTFAGEPLFGRRDVSLPSVVLEVPYRLEGHTLSLERSRLKLGDVPLAEFRVPGEEMRRNPHLAQE